MQTEIDTLKKRIAELESENAKVMAENAKLRRAMEENSRLKAEVAKLKHDVLQPLVTSDESPSALPATLAMARYYPD